MIFDFKLDPNVDSVTWTDIIITRDSLSIHLKKREYMMPKYFGDCSMVLRSLLVGLVHRLSELPLSLSEKTHCIVDFLCKIKAAGVEKKYVKKAIFGAKVSHPATLMLVLRLSFSKVYEKTS